MNAYWESPPEKSSIPPAQVRAICAVVFVLVIQNPARTLRAEIFTFSDRFATPPKTFKKVVFAV
jgi:hypothetical protein